MRTAAVALTALAALGAAAEAPVVFDIGTAAMPATATAAAGVWEFRPGGAIVLVTPAPGNRLEMTVLDSPDYTMAPHSSVAVLESGAEPGVYDMHLAVPSEALGGDGGGRRTRDAVVRVDAAGRRLTMTHFARRRSVSFRRWLAAIFHASPTQSDRPDDLDGAVRLFPDPYIDPMPL